MAAAAADLEARRRSEAVHEAASRPAGRDRRHRRHRRRRPASRYRSDAPVRRAGPGRGYRGGPGDVVLLGAWNLSLRSELDSAQRYQQQVAAVLDAARVPGALTAVMTTTGQGPNGIAAVTPDGEMRIAMRDLGDGDGSTRRG